MLSLLFCASAPTALLVKLNGLRRQNEQQRIDGALPETPDVTWVGPLVDALETRKPRSRALAAGLLPRLLLRMRPRHSELLTPEQWETLGGLLRENGKRDTELNLATLQMLERMGDDAMLSFVEAAAASSAWTYGTWRVRRTARHCLDLMDARLQAEEARRETAAAAIESATTAEARPEQHTLNPELAKLLAELDELRRGQGQPGMRLGFLLAAYLTILPVAAWKAAETMFMSNWLSFALWSTVVVATTQLYRFSLFPRHRHLMRKLAACDDVAGVGVLIETLEWPDRRAQEVAARALIRLLPRLRASDARLLTQPQRACLYRMLRMRYAGRDGALILAILQALQQVGDEAAIPYVRRLASSAAFTPTQRKVKQAAEECQPYLKSSADLQRASQTLLRASAQENVAEDGLLRPAYARTETESTELLRAVVAGQAGTAD